MGCDFYIDTNLYIYYFNSNNISYISLSHDRGYFYESLLDEDNENYEKKYEEMHNEQLKARNKPIIIYDNNKFITPNLETKYKKLIEDNFEKNYKSRRKI